MWYIWQNTYFSEWLNVVTYSLKTLTNIRLVLLTVMDGYISGDGRMDSPGYCAQYCTYTIMNQADKKILALEVVDKRETNLKSGLMEAKGFVRALESVQRAGKSVKEIVTDAHPQISSLMSK